MHGKASDAHFLSVNRGYLQQFSELCLKEFLRNRNYYYL